MPLCNHSIDTYVRNGFFDRLNDLPPIERAVEKLRFEIEALDFELRETDELLGWFKFQDTDNKWRNKYDR
ncbi:MAG: hypothetical protein PUE85_07810 [Firmicutes bacterium]|nr:hypothetical protein [Bacillota bacterium]